MRRIFADRGMTLGMKCVTRGVERDNEEAEGRFQHRRGPRWRLVNERFNGQFFPVDVVNCFIGFVASISSDAAGFPVAIAFMSIGPKTGFWSKERPTKAIVCTLRGSTSINTSIG